MPLLLLLAILLFPAAASAEGFRRALPGYDFSFPRDHGSHPDFRTEWWYFTGNLADGDGRRFGFKLTFFRSALAPPGEGLEGRTPLAANQLFLGHFAISDFESRRHRTWERLGRAGFGQAEAAEDRLHVRLGEWMLEMDDDGRMTLRALAEGGGIDLRLTPAKPFVIHGRDGVHQKAAEEGQASHYISFTRLATEGILHWDGGDYEVTGLSWMDHEFGSDQLGREEIGWDWFALQLETGEDLMVYHLRRRDGTPNPHSLGSLVDPEGRREELGHGTYTIEHTGTWTSPISGGTYPMGWTISLPSHEGELTVTPVFKEQEMDTTRYTGAYYWEGAVAVSGTWRGREVSGRGYVELVGYAGEFDLL